MNLWRLRLKSNNKWFRLFQVFTALMDGLILYSGYFIAAALRSHLADDIERRNIVAMTGVLPYVCVTGLALLYMYGVYNMRERSRFDVLYSIVSTVFFLLVITMALSFLTRDFAFPRGVILFGAGVQLVLLSVMHVFTLRIGQKLHGRRKVLVVGHGAEMQAVEKKFSATEARFFQISHFFDLDKEQYKSMRPLIERVEHVFICPSVTQKERHKIFSYCISQDTSIFIFPDLFDISVNNGRLQTIDDTPVLKINQLSLTWEQRILKRAFDLVFSILFVIAASPVMLCCYLAVKFSSPGPAIFKQKRITEGSRLFRVYKFRTMYMNAESVTGPVLASEKDPRITKVGAVLRRARLDELPQFFNGIKGEMSVVGPRPERPFFIEQFKAELPDYDYRAAVKAGITGYAQVMGRYTTSASDKLRFDLWYIRNYSIWMDITLILRTVRLLFTSDAARGVMDEDDIPAVCESAGKNGSSRRSIRLPESPR
jgi:exopolysaccharide biosynthesis polyprenyl glycosylphosphotransferase